MDSPIAVKGGADKSSSSGLLLSLGSGRYSMGAERMSERSENKNKASMGNRADGTTHAGQAIVNRLR
jgi:hypothetical protein